MPDTKPWYGGSAQVSRRTFLAGAACAVGGLSVTRPGRQPGPAGGPAGLGVEADTGVLRWQPRAKQVIFLYLAGGPSHIDTFDYKPALIRLHGQPVPSEVAASLPDAVRSNLKASCADKLFAGPWRWQQHGQSGLWMSDLLPHLAQHADDLCVIASAWSDGWNHADAARLLLTGTARAGQPSLGSRLVHMLPGRNPTLPGYVVLSRSHGPAGFSACGGGDLPADCWPVSFPLPGQQDFRLDVAPRHAVGQIVAMTRERSQQLVATGIDKCADQTQRSLRLYGVDDRHRPTAEFGRLCLMARCLVERGVRFVQVNSAADKIAWDGHSDLVGNHRASARQVDRPVAALLSDLKRRGLLDETLVVWAGEFGRTPMAQNGNGRGHNPLGFAVWLAGAGVRAGTIFGATDEIGLQATVDRCAIGDLHATIASRFGLNDVVATTGRVTRAG